MTGSPLDPPDLEGDVREVYRGPFEDFVSRRATLSKRLKGEKRRADADLVKALRKPGRLAWALDQVAHDEPELFARVEAAIVAAQQVQGRGDEARAAHEGVRVALRSVAEAGARLSGAGGPTVAALVGALKAVIGDASALAELRAGRLAEIPEGGGLDLLVAAVPLRLEPTAAPPSDGNDAQREAGTAAARAEAQRAEARRAEALRAEALLREARDRAEAAARGVMRAQAKSEAADERLERARSEADERRGELERARSAARAALDEVAAAERVAGNAGGAATP